MTARGFIIALAVAAFGVSPGESPVQDRATSLPSPSEIRTMAARFAPVEIGADTARLPAAERRVLGRLVEAARIMDALFLRQVSAGNDALLQQLSRETLTGSPDAAARLHYFLINKGPWSRLDHDRPFIAGAGPKPPAANFYPAGATKDEVQRWLESLAGPARSQAIGFFTTIRRAPGASSFVAVPYSVEYQGELAQAAALLREAAALTAEPSLKAYLSARADAVLPNDYYASGGAWTEIDA